jgi:hypothetical protein
LDADERFAPQRMACDHFCFHDAGPRSRSPAAARRTRKSLQGIAGGLPYRDFMTAGLLLRRMKSLADGKARRHGPR